jgi:hypothetical protein
MPQSPHPRPDTLFKPGNPYSGNRKGHKGARQQLAALVFADVAAIWEEQGPGFMRRLAFHDMAAFASFVAKIMPQRIEHETATPFDHVDEQLLAISMRVSQAIAYLPDDDREMLGMLLDKAEQIATSQKTREGIEAEEGVGGQSSQEFFGGKGSPLPQTVQITNAPNPASQNSGGFPGGSPIPGPAVAADITRESSFPAETDENQETHRARSADVLDAEFEEEP